jgi:hypothetical protein
MADSPPLVPLTTAFETLRGEGLQIDRGGLQRMVDAEMLEKTERLKGRRGFGIGTSQLERLRTILQVRGQMRSRPTLARLALEVACLKGLPMPNDLIAMAVEDGIVHLLRWPRRGLQRLGRGDADLSNLNEVEAAKLSRTMARSVVRKYGNIETPRRVHAQQVISHLLFVFLRVVYGSTRFASHARDFRQVAMALGVAEEPARISASELANVLSGADRLVSNNVADNEMVAAVRSAIRKDPESIARVLPDCAVLETLWRMFPEEMQPERLSDDPARTWEDMRPFMVALLLVVRDNPETHELMREFRQGNFEKVRPAMETFRQMASEFPALVGLSNVSNETSPT